MSALPFNLNATTTKAYKSGKATSDVFNAGEMIYKNAMGFDAVVSCIKYLRGQKIEGVIVDPFCGQGSVLKIANDCGYSSIGVDILEEQTKIAEKI